MLNTEACVQLEQGNAALGRLREVCEGRGIRIRILKIDGEFLIFHENKKLVLVDPLIKAPDINRFIEFIEFIA